MPNSTKLGHYLSAIVRTILNMPKQTQLRWGQNGVRESKHILSLQNFRWRNHYPRLSNNSCISSSFICFVQYAILQLLRILLPFNQVVDKNYPFFFASTDYID